MAEFSEAMSYTADTSRYRAGVHSGIQRDAKLYKNISPEHGSTTQAASCQLPPTAPQEFPPWPPIPVAANSHQSHIARTEIKHTHRHAGKPATPRMQRRGPQLAKPNSNGQDAGREAARSVSRRAAEGALAIRAFNGAHKWRPCVAGLRSRGRRAIGFATRTTSTSRYAACRASHRDKVRKAYCTSVGGSCSSTC